MRSKTPSSYLNKLVKSGIIVVMSIALYSVVSFALVFWPADLPFDTIYAEESAIPTIDTSFSNTGHLTLPARDGKSLYIRKIGADSKQVIVFLHGIASTHKAVLHTAQQIHAKTGAQVLLPDLRGHGLSEGDAFDVSYIGQYEDDLEDLLLYIKSKSTESSNQIYRQIIIGGHSMGGGISMRYALKDNKPEVDAYLLIAPNFGEGPTQRQSTAKETSDAPVYFNTKRMIGLLMLNTIGMKLFDSLPIMFFNFPPKMMAYSYASIMSAQPIRPHTADKALNAIHKPLLTLIGEQDEVFLASAYPDFIENNTMRGSAILIKDANHTSVLFSENAIEQAVDWLKAVF